MRAFGFGAGRRDRPHPPVPVAPAVAPGRLAALATAPYAAFGTQRLTNAYTGPLFQLRRASDGATQDFAPPAGGDYPDRSAIAAWAGTSALSIVTLYDQTGNGRHLAQPTVANQPGFDLSQAIGNAVPILIDGYGRGAGPQPQIAKTPSVGSLVIDQQAVSIFATVQSKVSFNPAAIAEFRDEANATSKFAFVTNANMLGQRTGTKSSIDTMGFTLSPTARTWYTAGGSTVQTVATASSAYPRLTLGQSLQQGVSYNGMYRLFGMVLYGAALSNADGLAVQASLNTAFAVPASYDYRLVFDGDSIMEGSGGLLLRNMPSWLGEGLTKKAEMYNMAVHGQTLATIYANRVARFGSLVLAGKPSVFFENGGTNDLGAGTTGANLYANSAAPLVSYLKGLGFKVVLCTVLPRSDAAWTGAMETERGNYNALVRANSAGADHVLDLTQNPVMGGAAANTGNAAYFVDKLHPTALGYRNLAGAPSGAYAGAYTYLYALRQVLGATP